MKKRIQRVFSKTKKKERKIKETKKCIEYSMKRTEMYCNTVVVIRIAISRKKVKNKEYIHIEKKKRRDGVKKRERKRVVVSNELRRERGERNE